MANTQLVDILDSANEFLKQLTSVFLSESLILHDNVEQLATVYEFHHEVEVFFGFNDLVDLYNVGVVQLLKNFDFSANSFNVFFVFNAWFFEDFNGHLIQKSNQPNKNLLFLQWGCAFQV